MRTIHTLASEIQTQVKAVVQELYPDVTVQNTKFGVKLLWEGTEQQIFAETDIQYVIHSDICSCGDVEGEFTRDDAADCLIDMIDEDVLAELQF